MALYQPAFGDDVAVATPGSAVGAPSGGVSTFWTPGFVIAGLAIAAIFFMKSEERRLRRRAGAGRRRPAYRRG